MLRRKSTMRRRSEKPMPSRNMMVANVEAKGEAAADLKPTVLANED